MARLWLLVERFDVQRYSKIAVEKGFRICRLSSRLPKIRAARVIGNKQQTITLSYIQLQ